MADDDDNLSTGPQTVVNVVMNLSTHPLDGDIDLGTKRGVDAFNKATELDSTEKRLELTVSNSKELALRIKMKVADCRMQRFLRIPTSGTGVPVATTARNGTVTVKWNDFGDFVNLLESHDQITLSQCQDYAQYNWGDNTQTRTHTDGSLRIEDIDPNDLIDNVDETKQLKRLSKKQQYRIRAEMMATLLKNIIKSDDYKLLIDSDEPVFTFESDDGDKKIDGFLMLKQILLDIKPEVVVDVRDKEKKLESLTLKDCGNDVKVLTRTLESIWKDILKEKPGSYDNERFIRELFRALLTSTNPDFKATIKPMRSQWMVKKALTYQEIISEANTLFKNLDSENEWNVVSEDQTKIIALTTKYEKAMKEIKALETKIKSAGNKNDKNDQGNSGSRENNDAAWEEEKKWRCTQKGKFLTKNGKKYVWCEHHFGGKGMYMPNPHDHDKWVEERKQKKLEKKEKFKERRDKKDKSTKDNDKSSNNPTGKLNLAKHLTEALTTKVGVSDADAAKLADEILKSSKE